jgi:hypothetical protein
MLLYIAEVSVGDPDQVSSDRIFLGYIRILERAMAVSEMMRSFNLGMKLESEL